MLTLWKSLSLSIAYCSQLCKLLLPAMLNICLFHACVICTVKWCIGASKFHTHFNTKLIVITSKAYFMIEKVANLMYWLLQISQLSFLLPWSRHIIKKNFVNINKEDLWKTANLKNNIRFFVFNVWLVSQTECLLLNFFLRSTLAKWFLPELKKSEYTHFEILNIILFGNSSTVMLYMLKPYETYKSSLASQVLLHNLDK